MAEKFEMPSDEELQALNWLAENYSMGNIDGPSLHLHFEPSGEGKSLIFLVAKDGSHHRFSRALADYVEHVQLTDKLEISDLKIQLRHRTSCLDNMIVDHECLRRENIELRQSLAKSHRLIVRCGYCGEEICKPELWSKERAKEIMVEHLKGCEALEEQNG